jgi:hypothetical protein
MAAPGLDFRRRVNENHCPLGGQPWRKPEGIRTSRSARSLYRRQISSLSEKGVGNVIKKLRQDLPKLTKTGPVFAVIDRDKAREIWKTDPPADCMTAIRERIRKEATSGDYELVFLVQNMESLIDACDDGFRSRLGGRKPTPDERDSILGRVAWETPSRLPSILKNCPSFERLVIRVVNALALAP